MDQHSAQYTLTRALGAHIYSHLAVITEDPTQVALGLRCCFGTVAYGRAEEKSHYFIPFGCSVVP